MKYLKNTLAIIFIVVGTGVIVGYTLGIFNAEIRENYIPINKNLLVDLWGIFSAVFLCIGGVLIIKNNIVSMWFLAASIIMYFLGAIVPWWPQYGFNTFNFIINEFYYSLVTRIVLAILAIYALRKVVAANKSFKMDGAKSRAAI